MLEEIGVLYRGAILGLIIAAPVGPVGLLCIRRTLEKGFLTGFATGMGAAVADALFGAIAVLGAGTITAFLHHYEASIRIIGGLIVLGTAWHTWRDRPQPPQPLEIIERVLHLTQENILLDAVQAVISGFAMTAANPLTLFGTLAVVATFGEVTAKLDAALMIGGLFAGSTLWWVLLSSGMGLLRSRCSEDCIVVVNRVTAAVLAALAIWAVVSGVQGYRR